jgi:hypothetical protein
MEISKGKIKQTFILQDDFDSYDNLSILIDNNFNDTNMNFKIISLQLWNENHPINIITKKFQ